MRKITLFLVSLFLLLNLRAVEYFISLDGNDSNPGTSANSAFKTVKKAVDILKPGDILTILPGEYLQQALVKCSGTPEKPIVIRGTDKKFCILKGWKDINGEDFKAVSGSRFTYVAEIENNVFNVIESDTGQMLDPAPGIEDMDSFRSSYCYDKASKKLYIHSSDGKSPESHSFKVTVIPGYLLNPVNVKNMVIENLSFCGSYAEDSRMAGWGYAIRTYQCENILIRNCEFHYNCGGYSDSYGLKNTIRDCRLSNNLALGYGELGQIMFSMKSTDCTALNNIITDGINHGLRFYGHAKNVRAIGNIIVNDGIGLYYKATAGSRLAERNVVDECKRCNYSDLQGGQPIKDLWNTFATPSFVFDPNNSNLIFNPAKDNPNFCDTESLDYRLQSDSPYRKKGPDGKDAGAYQFEANVFFVSPNGNDNNDGLSVKSAFLTLEKASKKLKAGVTLYLLPGIYKEPLTVSVKGTPEKPVTIRSRGNSPGARVSSLLIDNAENIKIEKLSITEALIKNSQDVKLERIYSSKNIEILSCKNVQLGYSTILSEVKIGKSSGVELHHSILSSAKEYLIVSSESPALFSEYNNFISPENKFALIDNNKLNSLDAMKKYVNGMRYCISSPDCFKIVDGKPYLSPSSICSSMDGKGMAIGAFEIWHDVPVAEITDVKVNYLSPSSASISWTLPNTSSVLWRVRGGWSDGRPVLSYLKYGTTPDCGKKIVSLGDIFNSVTINGLEAGKKYYFKIEVPKNPEVWLPDTNLPPFKMLEKFMKTWKAAETELASFTTPAKFTKPACRTLYLSPKGSDGNDGLSRETAWKSLKKASVEVRPGDTVILCDGVYEGTFRPVVSGLPDFKITLKAENCGSAVIDGSNFTRPCGILLDLCSHVVIDGIVLENFSAKLFGNRAGMDYGQLEIIRSGDITARNCIFNAHGQYQSTVLKDVFDIKFINNVFMFSPAQIAGHYINNIEFRGNTFFYTLISNFNVFKFAANSEVIIKNNLFAGLSKQKVLAHGVGINGEWKDFFSEAKNKNIKFVCDYNAWYFSPSDPYNFCGFEDFPSDIKLPLGVKRLQDKFGIEKHSIEIKNLVFTSGIPVDYMSDDFNKLFDGFLKKNKLTLKSFELPDNSPLKNSGENGVRIGAGIPNTK
ncbi:MAG: hypothetical protein A2017_13845 [Lentisphaerae bacterium GWF2_44_16]|nr:MAG: hypothetical protein A2017_13845 [Lentisphaerae bacterium GWF2_44_16]